ncbi:MAG: hypothetical protein GOU98_00015 [Candidatus Altiarchaeota archaeon]|nr:hypothetical protein [Candidatus Altiarchaeota archaeon]
MKLQALLTAMILLAPIVADSHEVVSGINPDSILWGLDVALDKISLALTANPEKKAEKALEIAQERLMEVKAMAEANKFEAIAKAEKEHKSTLLKVEESINDLSEDDPEVQIEKELELEVKLKEHKESVERVKTELKVKIQVEGELTVEQQARLDEFLASLSENTENAQIQIQNKKDDTKIKIKIKTGETEIEVEQRIEKLEIEHGLLEEKIEVRGKVYGNKTYVKLELEYDTNKTVLNEVLDEFLQKLYLDTNKADALLEMESGDEIIEDLFRVKVEIEDDGSEIEARLRFVVDATERNQVVDAIVSKTNMELSDIGDALEVKQDTEDEEDDEIEIEVEVKGNQARVKLKFGDEKTRLELETGDHAEILAAIATQLGLSVEEIEEFVKFEDEDGNEIEDESEVEEESETESEEEDEAETEDDEEDDDEDESSDTGNNDNDNDDDESDLGSDNDEDDESNSDSGNDDDDSNSTNENSG